MRLDENEQSDNLEDLRGSSGGGGFGGGGMPIPGGRGGLGIIGIIVLSLIGYQLGIDPSVLINGAQLVMGGGGGGQMMPQQAPQAFADAIIKVRDWFLLERRTDDGLRRR